MSNLNDDDEILRFDQPNPTKRYDESVATIKNISRQEQQRESSQSTYSNDKNSSIQFNHPTLKEFNQNRDSISRLSVQRYKNPIEENDQNDDLDQQIMFLDDINDKDDKKVIKINRLLNDLDEANQTQPKFIGLKASDNNKTESRYNEGHNQDDEDQILIFDQVKTENPTDILGVPENSQWRYNYQNKRDSKQTNISFNNSPMKQDAPNLQQDLIQKFELNESYDQINGKTIEQQYKKTESVDRSKDFGEIQIQSLDVAAFNKLTNPSYFEIGLNASIIPSELKASNRISINGDFNQISFLRAVKHTLKNPTILYVLILIIIDKIFTDLATWKFSIVYLILLITVPTLIWFFYFKKSFQSEVDFDCRQISKYNNTFRSFQKIPRSQLQTGDLILLQRKERFPASLILLTILNTDQTQQVITLDNGDQMRLIASQLTENDLGQLSGRVEYDKNSLPLFSDNSSINLKLFHNEKVLQDISVRQNDLCAHDLSQDEGQVLALVILNQVKEQKTFQEISISEKLIYEHKDLHNHVGVIYFLIGTSIALSLLLSLVSYLSIKGNSTIHKYIQLSHESSFFYTFINHLLVYQSIVPIFLEIIRPLFAIIAMLKYNRDRSQDGNRSGATSYINSPQVMDNLGRLKFVNINSKILSMSSLRVTKCFLLTKENENDEIWPFANENPQYQEDIDKTQLDEVLERSILAMPFGELTSQFIALQQYCRLMNFTQYSYTNIQRTLLLPKELLKYFPLILTCKQADGTTFYLYELPQEEDEKEEKENEDEDEEDDEKYDIQKLHTKIENAKIKENYRKQKHYIWVLITNQNSQWIRNDPKLQMFLESVDSNTIFIKSCEIDEAEFKDLSKKLGKRVIKTKILEEIPDYLLEKLQQTLLNISCFTFEYDAKHDFNLLLDLNAAEIRQWIFTNNDLFDIEEPTLKYLQQYMYFTQLDRENDVQYQINSLKGMMATKTDQSLDTLVLQNNQYTIERQYITLVLTQDIIEAAFQSCKSEFLEFLLMPSFIIFLNISQDQIQEIMRYQKVKAVDQTILTFGADREDISFCERGTIRACLSEGESNIYSEMCDLHLTNVNALSKLVLTHARQTYIRTSQFSLFQIYKSLLITMAEFFFSFYNGFSSSILYTFGFHFLYEALFTSFFSLILFSFYSDVNHSDIRGYAVEYTKCQRDHYYNKTKIFLILIDSIYQGFIIFYVPAQVFQYANDATGIIEGFYFISMVSYITLIFTVSFQPFIYFSTINKEQVWLVIINSIGVILVLMIACSSNQQYTLFPEYVQHINALLNSIKSIFIVCFLIAINLTPTLIVHQYLTVCDPSLMKMIHNYKDEEEDQEEGEEENEEGDKKKKIKNEKEAKDNSIIIQRNKVETS